MVNRNLLRQYEPTDDQLRDELEAAFDQGGADWLPAEEQEFRDNKVVTGRVRKVTADHVWVDVGYKSEGAVELREWFDEGAGEIVLPRPGDEIEVLLEAVEDETGAVVLSYYKAKRQKQWREVVEKHKEGDVVSGVVARKIKGGLLVNIGVHAFLPASQVDIRRPQDIAVYVGQTIECKIAVIDEARRNIVVSRRKLLEDRREEMKTKLLAEIEVGQLRKGVVKNIAQFGAFVDLGGIDGLLHVTDMAWNRVSNPADVVHIDQELEVVVLKIDREKEKIALGLKQKTPSPWATVADKYPVGSRHVGDMSWVRKVAHPSEVVQKGD
ncbi:MAG TPA: S1 RNA-binding domain-containing protein, partial [Gemmataceae bacterium]|nr:S1 RNA-binding domain-containing protein [Gemmataceae bacterium]